MSYLEDRRNALEPHAASPLIPLTFPKDGVTLSYFSLVTTLGTPLAVVAEVLRLECRVPADDETEQAHADSCGSTLASALEQPLRSEDDACCDGRSGSIAECDADTTPPSSSRLTRRT